MPGNLAQETQNFQDSSTMDRMDGVGLMEVAGAVPGFDLGRAVSIMSIMSIVSIERPGISRNRMP